MSGLNTKIIKGLPVKTYCDSCGQSFTGIFRKRMKCPHCDHEINFKNPPKYPNKHTICLSQHHHPSALEAQVCNRLLARKQNGEIKDFRTQVKYTLAVPPLTIELFLDIMELHEEFMKSNLSKEEIAAKLLARANVDKNFVANHIVDFELDELDDSITVWEAKGKEMDRWQLMRNLFPSCYPDVPYQTIKE